MAEALPPVDLGEFEDRTVARTGIKVTNAGDGLSQALKVDPQLLHHGDVVHVALRCEVTKVYFDEADGDGQELVRIHVLKAGSAAIVDEKTVKKAIDAQAERIRKAAEEAAGMQGLFDEAEAIAAEEAQAEREAAEKAAAQ